MTPVLLVGDAPEWAAPRPRGPLYPDKTHDYVKLMELLVQTLRQPPYNVRYWELWPEPDAMDTIPEAVAARYGPAIQKRRAWGDHGAQYAEMLKATCPAITRADPNAIVVLGALAYDWFGANCPGFNCGGIFNYAFLDEVLAAGGACCFDVLAFNNYAVFAPGWEEHAGGRDLVAKTNALRERLRRHGVQKPLMVLEAGVWSAGSPVPERMADGQVVTTAPSAEAQAAYVAKLYARAASLGLLSVSWYSFFDFGADEQRGLVTEARAAKPAFRAYQAAADWLLGASFTRALPSRGIPGAVGELEGYAFVGRDGQPFTMLWLAGAKDAQATVRFSVPPGTPRVIVYDVYGQQQHVAPAVDGVVSLPLTTAPVYLQATVELLAVSPPAPPAPPAAPAAEPPAVPAAGQPAAAPPARPTDGPANVAPASAAASARTTQPALPSALPRTGDAADVAEMQPSAGPPVGALVAGLAALGGIAVASLLLMRRRQA
jgi:hypothetical protein